MERFISCGVLESQKGTGLILPWFLKIKNGIMKGDFRVVEYVKDGKLNFPVEIKKVVGHFKCHDQNLTSLEGCPEIVVYDFDCSGNKLTSLEGCPKEVGWSFYIYDNTKKFTEEEVRAVCKVSGNVFV